MPLVFCLFGCEERQDDGDVHPLIFEIVSVVVMKQFRIRSFLLGQQLDAPCSAVVGVLLLKERAHLFDAVAVIPSGHYNAIMAQRCQHGLAVLLSDVNALSDDRNGVIGVPLMRSNAAMTTTAPAAPSHLQNSQRWYQVCIYSYCSTVACTCQHARSTAQNT